MTTPQPPRAFCCEPMRGYSTAKCQEHRAEPALCSDVLVVHSERHGPGLPIHVDGGGGMIVIEFCPWCGTRIGDGAGTACPADARQRAVETAGQWLLLDPKAWQRNPAIAGTVDALIAHPDVLAALAARTPGKPRPHLQRRVWKGEDGKDQHGPWHPCPTCPQEVVRQSASELDRTTFGDDAHAAFCDGTCKDWEAGDQLPGTGGRMCPQQPGRALLAGGEQS